MKNMLKNTKIFSVTKKVKMKKLYCVICGKYREFKNPKISYIFDNTLVVSITYSKCKNEDEKAFKEEKSTEVLKEVRNRILCFICA